MADSRGQLERADLPKVLHRLDEEMESAIRDWIALTDLERARLAKAADGLAHDPDPVLFRLGEYAIQAMRRIAVAVTERAHEPE